MVGHRCLFTEFDYMLEAPQREGPTGIWGIGLFMRAIRRGAGRRDGLPARGKAPIRVTDSSTTNICLG